VIDQQPQIELGSLELRRREPLEALAQRRPGDVDRVGLPALATAAPNVGHQPGRDSCDALAPFDQEPLERSRYVPAVLERPHALITQLARPGQQRAEPLAADLDRSLAEQLAGRRTDSGDRV
jgi:hypothetical protein